jgi:hypothetical protein
MGILKTDFEDLNQFVLAQNMVFVAAFFHNDAPLDYIQPVS